MLTIEDQKIKSGVAFRFKNDRKTYIVVQTHRNDEVSYALDRNVSLTFAYSRYGAKRFVASKENITRVAFADFAEKFSTFTEGKDAKQARLAKEAVERAENLSKMLDFHKEALGLNILFDAVRGGDVNTLIARFDEFVAEIKADAKEKGAEEYEAEQEAREEEERQERRYRSFWGDEDEDDSCTSNECPRCS